jgi:BASS family bile acid:Na+ symporter
MLKRLQHLTLSAFHVLHERFFLVMLAVYAIASVLPHLGLWIRDVHLASVPQFGGGSIVISLPLAMLSLLLFTAGLSLNIREAVDIFKHPALLLCGLALNLLLPIAFTFAVSQTMSVWHDSEEVQNILVGLALIASMPIAASSTAWTQKSNGNLALSLGLVAFSTLLSPLTTPIGLHAIGFVAVGDFAEDLHELAEQGTGMFLAVSVLLPTLLGIGVRLLFGAERVTRHKEIIRAANLVNLLLLNYSNASVVLPQTFANPDWDFLAVTLLIAATLCGIAFCAGWFMPRFVRSGGLSEQVSMMFGLGMNNNGTGLVLASMALADHPTVMLPIIFYNIVQQIIAGVVDWRVLRNLRKG